MGAQLPPHLEKMLDVMSSDMGVPRGALLSQAVFTLARLNGYAVPSELPASEPASEAPFEPVAREPEPVETAPAEVAKPRATIPSIPVAAALEDDDSLSDIPDPDVEPESTIVRRSNQAVRIRAIADDVARLTIPYRCDPEPEEPSADDDEWLDSSDETVDDAASDDDWDSTPFKDNSGFYDDDEGQAPKAAESPAPVAVEETVAEPSAAEDPVEVPTEKAGAAEENDDDWDPFDKAEAMSEAGMDWSQIGAEKPGATESPGPEQDSAEPEPEPAEVSQERVKTRVGEDEPAWVETDSPEKDVAPKPVMGEPTEVEPRKDVGPLLGSKRGSEGDYDRLLADLDDLETGARELSDEHVDKATDVAEARSRLLLAVEGGKSVEVLKTPFVIGRTRSCDLQIISERVSRTHAVIEADGPLGFKIVDKNSSNGLWIGRERIKEHALQDGDVFRVGDRRITAKIQVSTEAD